METVNLELTLDEAYSLVVLLNWAQNHKKLIVSPSHWELRNAIRVKLEDLIWSIISQ